MRIHTDLLKASDIYSAAIIARVNADVTEHRSRSRARAFNVTLRGESNRKPNYGTSREADRFADDRAATWDQWGVFLAVLFDADPNMFTPYDGNQAHFNARTNHRFNPDGNDRDDQDPQGFWPDDAHGDHSWWPWLQGERSCRKCSAVERNDYALDRLIGAF